MNFNRERTHLMTRYLVFSDITCEHRKWDIGIGDRQTAKRKVRTICWSLV